SQNPEMIRITVVFSYDSIQSCFWKKRFRMSKIGKVRQVAQDGAIPAVRSHDGFSGPVAEFCQIKRQHGEMLGSAGSGHRLQYGFIKVGAEKDAARVFKVQYGLYLTNDWQFSNCFRLLGTEAALAQPVFQAAANVAAPQGEGIVVRTAAGIGGPRRYARSGGGGLNDR